MERSVAVLHIDSLVSEKENDDWVDRIQEAVLAWLFFFFSSRRRHTRFDCDWSSDVCSSDLGDVVLGLVEAVAVELVHEVATLGADADPAKAVLEPGAEVAGELGPRAVGAEIGRASCRERV